MQTDTIPKGKGISYNHTLLTDKHFFGGFFNLAENNKEAAYALYKQRFGKSILEDVLKPDSNVSEPDYIDRVEFLKQYLPVVKYLDLPVEHDLFSRSADKVHARREYLINNFKLLTGTVNDLRNFYTHYHHDALPLDSTLFNLLDNILLNVAKDVRKAKKKRDHTKQLVKDSLKDELVVLSEQKKQQLLEKGKSNPRVKLDDESIENSIFNDAFSHFLYKPKDAKTEMLTDRYKSVYTGDPAENNITISQNGIIFLLSMFLSRKEAKDLRSRMKGYKGNVIKDAPDFPNDRNNSLKFMATHWVYEYLNIKTIRPKLTTGFTKEKLLTEIVDYLTKVPDKVYQNLSSNDQQRFVEDTNEYFKDNEEADATEEARVIHDVIRKRYEDKFNYYALRYLDEFVDFPSLRFQLHIGNYTHHSQSKEINGTKYITERKIKEKVKIFGRLSEVTNIKSEYIQSIRDENSDIGWEEFPNPSFNFVGNNIPIHLNIDGFENRGSKYKDKRNTAEKRTGRGKRLHKQDVVNELVADNNSVIVSEPIAMLSLNELPALLYELLIIGKTGKQIEEILKKKLWQRFATIENYKPGELPNNQIPKKLNKSTGTDSINIDKLKRALQKELDISEAKLTLIKNNRREMDVYKPTRKYVFYAKELGAEAAWLADDLKRFMPIKAREQWKGYHHSQLQNSIAYYHQKPGEAFDLLRTVWNFNDDDFSWNSGIKKAFANNRFFDKFYEAYLNNRKKVLEDFLNHIAQHADDKKMLKRFIKQQHIDNLFYMRLYTIDNTQAIKEKLLAKPFVFPRGIFDDRPTFIKGTNVTDSPDGFAAWYQYLYNKHDYQEFYNYDLDYEENYKAFKISNDGYIENKLNLNAEEQEQKFKMNEDLAIKREKGKDVYLNLIANQLFTDLFKHSADFTLNMLYKDRQERIRIATEAKKQNDREKGDISENILNNSFIWDEQISFTNESGQITEKIRLKNIGKVKVFLNDKRVKKIMGYDPARKWTIQQLEDELYIKANSYETLRREEILKAIQHFEKFIIDENGGHSTAFEIGEHPNFKMYMVNGVLQHIPYIDSGAVDWLKNCKEDYFNKPDVSELNTKPEEIQKVFLLTAVRNKVGHNQLPVTELYNLIKNTVPNHDGLTTTEILLTFTQQIIEYFQNILKNK
ncbi:type VI-B CRISPR-associated RNA-guided ribonuclease Cas13b [Flavobacterium rhizosphaerae]|uniref:Type VI-B CRISPR-associated RNA-guided ribonuclease Cas13b n=1 Tax=Flavobacterium rhizosphaerae TaxID=3163298 RepID=A0ABW8Z010_9FLAO